MSMLKTQKITGAVLITLWCAGLLFGILLSASNLSLFTGFVRVAPSERPAFLVLLLRNCLPVVLLYIILLRSAFFLTYPLVFFDALSRGFCAMCTIGFVGSGAWLLRIMLLFSAGCVSILIWYLLFRCLQCKKRFSLPNVFVISAFLILTTIFDYFCVSPFLLSLSNYF